MSLSKLFVTGDPGHQPVNQIQTNEPHAQRGQFLGMGTEKVALEAWNGFYLSFACTCRD